MRAVQYHAYPRASSRRCPLSTPRWTKLYLFSMERSCRSHWVLTWHAMDSAFIASVAPKFRHFLICRSCATQSRHREKSARSPNQRPGTWDAELGDISPAKLDKHPYGVITAPDVWWKCAFRLARAGPTECQEDIKNVMFYVANCAKTI